MSDSTNITTETIAKLAKLARLKLTQEEVKNGTEQLSHVLQNFAMIQGIEINDDALSQIVSELSNVARVDEAKPNNLCATEKLIDNVPETYKGQVKVKAVFS